MNRQEKYEDILDYIEMRLDLMQAANQMSYEKDYHIRQKCLYVVEQKQKQIQKWLNEEVDD